MNVRFFVTGHGRSGTMWLARLLDKCNPGIHVHHEPIPTFDRRLYSKVFSGELTGEEFARLREPKMQRVIDRNPDAGYAEVNSYLRYCAPEMGEAFGVPVAAMRRNKEDTVNSMMSLGLFERPGYPEIPAPDGLSPLESCEWYWEVTYRGFDADGVPIYELEELNKHFDYFVGLCDFLGCNADESIWRTFSGKKVNKGK